MPSRAGLSQCCRPGASSRGRRRQSPKTRLVLACVQRCHAPGTSPKEATGVPREERPTPWNPAARQSLPPGSRPRHPCQLTCSTSTSTFESWAGNGTCHGHRADLPATGQAARGSRRPLTWLTQPLGQLPRRGSTLPRPFRLPSCLGRSQGPVWFKPQP